MAKPKQKIQARELRKNGQSIKDIAKELKVSTGSVSRWCTEIELTKKQAKALYQKMIRGNYVGRLKGAATQKKRKEAKIESYYQKAESELETITRRELLMAGLGLYAGERSKKGNRFEFVNANPVIITFMIRWLELFSITRKQMYGHVMLNQIYEKQQVAIKNQWHKITEIPIENITKTVIIKVKNKKIYKNSNHKYLGTFILRVYKSSGLQYRVLGLMKVLMYK